MSPRRRIAIKIRRFLARSRVGQWLLISRYPTYLDQFCRMMLAVDAYHFRVSDPAALRYRLHRCIHRLEKGLSMPERRRGFGKDNFIELVALLKMWREVSPENHPSFTWGVDAGTAYLDTLRRDCELVDLPAEEQGRLSQMYQSLARSWPFARTFSAERTTTPIRWSEDGRGDLVPEFEAVLHRRKSVRRWREEAVPAEIVELALHHALQAPSACNRQPFGVVAVRDPERIVQISKLLTGGGGFAAQAPAILALVSDYGAYGGHEQRNLAFIDGGLAAMSFLLSLTAQGYGTVSMNWSVEVERDRSMRHLLGIRETQVILFFVAVGKPHPEALIPASIRRPITDSVKWIPEKWTAPDDSRNRRSDDHAQPARVHAPSA